MIQSRQLAEDFGKNERDVMCPECGAKMRLGRNRFGLVYRCEAFPRCKATHGAHPNGEPLGIPADAATKVWRVKAHIEFDKLWTGNSSSMSRAEAYRWMIETMAISKSDAHIGMFSIGQCQQLVAALAVRDQLDIINRKKRT